MYQTILGKLPDNIRHDFMLKVSALYEAQFGSTINAEDDEAVAICLYDLGWDSLAPVLKAVCELYKGSGKAISSTVTSKPSKSPNEHHKSDTLRVIEGERAALQDFCQQEGHYAGVHAREVQGADRQKAVVQEVVNSGVASCGYWLKDGVTPIEVVRYRTSTDRDEAIQKYGTKEKKDTAKPFMWVWSPKSAPAGAKAVSKGKGRGNRA